MQVYIFCAKTLKEIQIGIENRLWGVEACEEPEAWARLGRARQMPVGAPGLFHCSAEPAIFTTPFIVESRPEEKFVTGIWEQPFELPFAIRPIGDTKAQVLLSHARLTWPNLKGRDDVSSALNLSPSLAFSPSFVPRYDWDIILEQLNMDPEIYEDLFTAAPGMTLKAAVRG